MDLGNLHKKIVLELSRGIARKDIFKKLCSVAAVEQEKKIALVIACTPDEVLRRTFAKRNILLCLFLIFNGFLVLATEFPLDPQRHILLSWAKIFMPFVLAAFCYSFYGVAYRFIALWSLFEFIEIGWASALSISFFVCLKLLVVFITMVLSWHIGCRVFPQLGLLGLRKDHNGDYLL